MPMLRVSPSLPSIASMPLPLRLGVRMKQVFGKVHDLIGAADFVIQKRQFDDVKVFVKILDLFQVFPLHLASGIGAVWGGGMMTILTLLFERRVRREARA